MFWMFVVIIRLLVRWRDEEVESFCIRVETPLKCFLLTQLIYSLLKKNLNLHDYNNDDIILLLFFTHSNFSEISILD